LAGKGAERAEAQGIGISSKNFHAEAPACSRQAAAQRRGGREESELRARELTESEVSEEREG